MKIRPVFLFFFILTLHGAAQEKKHLLGTEKAPIRCENPSGERWYLSRLRTADGKRLRWTRQGSGGGEALSQKEHQSHIFDIYISEDKKHTLYFCMYHPQFIEILRPKGFRLVCEWSDDYEYINGKIHKWGQRLPFTGKILIEEENQSTEVTVEKGMIRGDIKTFYGDGQLQSVKRYENPESNYPHGVYEYYKSNGDLWVKYTFRNGILHGPFEYDPDPESGEKPMKGEYRDGRMVKE